MMAAAAGVGDLNDLQSQMALMSQLAAASGNPSQAQNMQNQMAYQYQAMAMAQAMAAAGGAGAAATPTSKSSSSASAAATNQMLEIQRQAAEQLQRQYLLDMIPPGSLGQSWNKK